MTRFAFAGVVTAAEAKGYDEIVVTPDATGCEIRLVQRQGSLTDAVLHLTTPFDAIERRALQELADAGWDARFTSAGVRAFKVTATVFRHEREEIARAADYRHLIFRPINIWWDREEPAPQTMRSRVA